LASGQEYYANGLGILKDRAKARELFVSLGPSDRFAVVLLDHDLLPRSPEDLIAAYLQVAAGKIADPQAPVIIAILATSAQRGTYNRAEEKDNSLAG
jgi:hypothetical protein